MPLGGFDVFGNLFFDPERVEGFSLRWFGEMNYIQFTARSSSSLFFKSGEAINGL